MFSPLSCCPTLPRHLNLPFLQCDLMARFFFNIGPFIIMDIRPKAYQFTKDGVKFCQILI